MELVPSTLIALAAIAVLLARGIRRGLWAFLALAPFGAAAAFNLPALGGASIGVFDLGAVTILVLVLLTRETAGSLVGTFRPWQPGFFFAGVIVIATISALFYPRLFIGETQVFGIARIEGQDGIIRFPLAPTAGNITQLFRLMLGFFTFAALATTFRRTPDEKAVLTAMAVATSVNLALGIIDTLTFRFGVTDLLTWLRSANYSMHITDTMGGLKRMIGGFPEASSFGYFSLGVFGFWLQYWLAAPKSKLGAWMLGIAAFSVLRSTSSAAYLALVVFLVTFGLYTFFRNLRPQVARRGVFLTIGGLLGVWVIGIAVFASYELVAAVTEFLDTVLFQKMGSDSGVERMGWNTQAMQNFYDTYGLGAGIGAVRASNWLIACLASFGIPGTALMLAFLVSLARAPAKPNSDPRAQVVRALKTGCMAMITAALLTHSTPDLGVFFFALAGLAAGLARGVTIESSYRKSV